MATTFVPDDRTNAKIDLKQSRVYQPGTEPLDPDETSGEVARAVTQEELENASTGFEFASESHSLVEQAWILLP